jgi:hypothetical protein
MRGWERRPDSAGMDDQQQRPVSGWRKGLRCFPFAVVTLCFLLPFFTVSSCTDNGDGPQATGFGIGIIAGVKPGVEQIRPAQQPSGPPIASEAQIESEAWSISQDARPWATAALILAFAGTVLMVRMGRLYRITSLAISAAALGAMFNIWGAVNVPSGDGTPNVGLLIASVVLFLTVVWQACAVTLLAVRAALNPRMNPEWEAQAEKAAGAYSPP